MRWPGLPFYTIIAMTTAGTVGLSQFLNDQKSDPKNRRFRILNPAAACGGTKINGPSHLLRASTIEPV